MSTTDSSAIVKAIQKPPHCDNGKGVEILTAREVPLGGPRAIRVRRTLPQSHRSLIGAWCFCDHFGPEDVSASGGMDVAPHPHTGLQTASWLFAGEVTHHDSGGNHAVVVPGEINLMFAGSGICHSEVSTQTTKVLHGVQLWIALPEAVRHGNDRSLDHFAPPVTQLDGAQALVFLGELFGRRSPLATHTPLLGAEIRLEPGACLDITVDPAFEHGFLVDSGTLDLEGELVEAGDLGYTGIGETSLRIADHGGSGVRLILLGGEPFTEDIVMWWNFIGRSHAEIAQARQEWEENGDRFGTAHGYISHDPEGPGRLPAPALPGVEMRPRANSDPIARPISRPRDEFENPNR